MGLLLRHSNNLLSFFMFMFKKTKYQPIYETIKSFGFDSSIVKMTNNIWSQNLSVDVFSGNNRIAKFISYGKNINEFNDQIKDELSKIIS